MNTLTIGSLPASISYSAMTASALLESMNDPFWDTDQPKWPVTENGLTIDSGLQALPEAAPYVLRATEEASFLKTFRRSPRIVHTGELR